MEKKNGEAKNNKKVSIKDIASLIAGAKRRSPLISLYLLASCKAIKHPADDDATNTNEHLDLIFKYSFSLSSIQDCLFVLFNSSGVVPWPGSNNPDTVYPRLLRHLASGRTSAVVVVRPCIKNTPMRPPFQKKFSPSRSGLRIGCSFSSGDLKSIGDEKIMIFFE